MSFIVEIGFLRAWWVIFEVFVVKNGERIEFWEQKLIIYVRRNVVFQIKFSVKDIIFKWNTIWFEQTYMILKGVWECRPTEEGCFCLLMTLNAFILIMLKKEHHQEAIAS